MKVVRTGMAPTLTVAATSLTSEMANIQANLDKAAKVNASVGLTALIEEADAS